MSLSSLNEGEYVVLLSTLKSIYDKRFSCSTCLSQPRKELLEKTQSIMACKALSPTPRHLLQYGSLDISYRRCIGNFTSASAVQWIQAQSAFDKGSLPFPGGYMDQPAKALEILSVIGGYKTEQEIKAAEARRLQSNSKVRRGR
jgi:hypothetical protein